jgi:hypothetical protein
MTFTRLALILAGGLPLMDKQRIGTTFRALGKHRQ